MQEAASALGHVAPRDVPSESQLRALDLMGLTLAVIMTLGPLVATAVFN